jgi:hypothetical protein
VRVRSDRVSLVFIAAPPLAFGPHARVKTSDAVQADM